MCVWRNTEFSYSLPGSRWESAAGAVPVAKNEVAWYSLTMMDYSQATAVAALRAAIESGDGGAKSVDLESHVAHYLFQDGRFGANDFIAANALETVAKGKSLLTIDDRDLFELWLVAVDKGHGAFMLCLDDSDSLLEFKGSCGLVFGQDPGVTSVLIDAFHGLAPGARYSILIEIARSSAFSYLNPLIDSFYGEVDLEPGTKALRMLNMRINDAAAASESLEDC